MQYLNEINDALERFLPAGDDPVSQAMRYSVRSGGKRVRPWLTLTFCALCGGDYRQAMPLACALEMIHTYSLIHDDLPCMDDDDLRRGRPACHVAFGEANALLAGDGLLTLAFRTAARAELPAAQTVQAVALIAEAAGINGMIGGQVMDLANEGQAADAARLLQTDRRKTGELIRAACVLGCIAANADEQQRAAAAQYADGIGVAFQIVDDILDVTGSAETLGKPIGSDRENDKSTYVSVLGLENARAEAEQYTENAKRALCVFAGDTAPLSEFADAMLRREH